MRPVGLRVANVDHRAYGDRSVGQSVGRFPARQPAPPPRTRRRRTGSPATHWPGFLRHWDRSLRAGNHPVQLPRAPRAKAYAERCVRTVRSECLDRTLIWNRGHLLRVLTGYLEHYIGGPHRGIALEAPVPVPFCPLRTVEPWPYHAPRRPIIFPCVRRSSRLRDCRARPIADQSSTHGIAPFTDRYIRGPAAKRSGPPRRQVRPGASSA
jgi:hypothetical protein